MKNLIGSIILFMSISILHSETVVRITANWVNILGSPSYQGQVIGQARQDETYIFQGSQGEWYEITLPDRRTGWILEAAGQIETEVSPPSQTQPSIPYKPPSYTPAPEGIYTIPDLWKRFSPAVVVIYTYDSNRNLTGQGTGFFVSNNGEIITNRHVLQGAYTAQVKTASGETFSVKSILAEDKKADLVKISIATLKRGFPIVTLAKKNPGMGKRVIVIGSPKGLEGSISEGLVSGIREIPGFGETIQTTAAISPGSSGSPVFNLNGEVVGVIASSIIEGQNLNFAVPASRIRTLKSCGEISLSDWSLGDIKAWLKTLDGLYWAGFMFLQNEDYVTAIKYFKKVVKLNPYDSDAYFWLGYCYFELGQYHKAVEPLKQAIYINSEDADAYCWLGVTYERLGRYGESIWPLKQAIRIDPEYANAYYNLGVVYSELGRHQEEIKAYKQAIRIDPEYADAYYNLGVVYSELGWYQETIKAYKQAIYIKPDYAEAHYNLGLAYLVLGWRQEALNEYQVLLNLDRELANELYNFIYR